MPHIAHVDHGWREESREEAEQIAQEAASLNCPFHSTRLQLKDKTEEAARKGRYDFFSSLAPQFDALLLAHQAEDLAETVLKRIFEGAHLTRLSGMQKVSHQHGMRIFRPLLNVRRAEILQFLEERALIPLIDPSNDDRAYLRARMRSDLFPFLKDAFGKEVVGNLTLLSERSQELKEYLDQKINRVPFYQGPWGSLADFKGLAEIEQRHLLQKMAREESIVFTREVLETLLNWVKEGGRGKFLRVKTRKILVDQSRIFIFSLNSKD